MLQNYTPELKKKIVRFHEEEGLTYKRIIAEWGVSKAAIFVFAWCKQFHDEFQTLPQTKDDYDSMKENLRLKRENEELQKEITFLKKAAAFFAKEIGEKLTGSLTNIMRNSAFASCCDDWGNARMPIITTCNEERRKSRSRSKRSTTATTE